ncbi:MAG: sensor histidine kinase [Verrucomicrobiia bacterium]
MWPAIIFAVLAILVVADSLWKERRLRRLRLQAKEDYAAQLFRQQQDAYAQAQAQQRALFDSMVDGVIVADKEGRIQLVNDSARRLFGMSSAAGRGQTLADAFDLPALAEIGERLQRESPVLGVELEVLKLPPQFLEINASAIRDREGAFRGGIFVVHDLTRLKQLENTRKDFVANVSHELRTPLSLIKGFAETLLEGAKDDPVVAVRHLRTIQKHADRLTYLIEDLLTISQLESKQAVLRPEPIALRAAVQHVADDLQAKGGEKKAEIRNEVPEGCFVQADAARLEQVLFNLVENALKYGQPDGLVVISGREHEGQIEVWVQDDGPGIPIDAQSRIFERFYRVDRARSRETGGTGLGLAIVKHIVLAHGGTVRVRSQPGQGATFYFTLPPASALEPASERSEG